MAFIRNNIINIIVVILVVIGGLYLYSYFFGGNSAPNSPLQVTAAADGNEVGRDLLLILADLQTLKLDDSVFSDPVFKNLKNFRVELTPEPVGRPNPFAPLSGAPGSSNSSIKIKGFQTQ